MSQRILIGIGLVISVAITTGVLALPETSEPPVILIGIGRFHPMIVHLPIGFLLFAFVILLAERFGKWSGMNAAFSIAIILGGLFAWLATALGFWLSLSGDYSEDLVFWHKIAALGVGWGSWVVFFLHVRDDYHKWRLPAFVPIALLLVVTGHFGGSLTHGENYIQDSFSAVWMGEMPGEGAPLVLHPDSLDLVYHDLVSPVLVRRCAGCHGSEKQKGDFRLDSFEALARGGESGEVLSAHEPAQSELFIRVTLPGSDEDRMPPDGKKPLEDAEIRMLRWWIESGADREMAWSDSTAPDFLRAYVASLMNPQTNSDGLEEAVAQTRLDPVLEKRFTDMSLTVVPVARGSHEWQVSFTNVPPDSVDAGIALLASLSADIHSLDLAGKPVSDFVFDALGRMNGLVRLYLQGTNTTDDHIATLGHLDNLEYLNLFGTRVTDAAFSELESLPALRRLYVWQSGVSNEAALLFEKRRGNLRVVSEAEIESTRGNLIDE